jgi:3-hydroxyisobutyrate dehydrogenase
MDLGFIGLGVMGQPMARNLARAGTPLVVWSRSPERADRHGLDMEQFLAVLDAGPMASSVSRAKARKLVARDFAVQASIANVLENTRLIAEQARRSGLASPLVDACRALYAETLALGHAQLDMAAVIQALEARTGSHPR